jgi:Protein of unknown function (DUF1573)
MRKALLSLAMLMLCAGMVFAKDKKHKKDSDSQQTTATPAAATPAPTTTLKPENLAFAESTHDFGPIMEGPDATCVFTFTNTGSEPINIQKAQPSCGCTVPSFSNAPVLPGQTGTINVAFHTKGKSNTFTKTITVMSNAGTKVLTIKGTVEKAPSSSVPENTSMIRTN